MTRMKTQRKQHTQPTERMATKICKQTTGHLRVGDVLRVLDKLHLGEIAVCVESDGHEEYPFACVVLSGKDQDREPIWPTRWVKLGNVVENVALLEREMLRLKELAYKMDRMPKPYMTALRGPMPNKR